MYEELGTSTRNKHDTIVKKDTAKLKSRLSQDLSSNAAKHRWMRSSTTYTSNRSQVDREVTLFKDKPEK